MFKKLLILPILFLMAIKIVGNINGSTFADQDQTNILDKSTNVLGSTTTVPLTNNSYVFASLPSFDDSIQTSVKTADARAEIIRQYLHQYESPLEPYSELIVELSDQNNFDYRWLVAIAQQESNLCKRIPENSYNCWGWGIYPDPANPEVLKVTRFDSFPDALRRIAPQFTRIFLKGNYSKDPMEVMKTYTPPSDGSWANGVNHFFEKLK